LDKQGLTHNEIHYLNALQSTIIIDRIPRYDLKEKEILKTYEKYFTGDQVIVYARNQGHHPNVRSING